MKEMSKNNYTLDNYNKYKKIDDEIKKQFVNNTILQKLYYEFEKQEDAIMASSLYLNIINNKIIMEMFNTYGISNDKFEDYILIFIKKYILELNCDFYKQPGILCDGSKNNIRFLDDKIYCSIAAIETSKKTMRQLIDSYIKNDNIDKYITHIVAHEIDIDQNISYNSHSISLHKLFKKTIDKYDLDIFEAQYISHHFDEIYQLCATIENGEITIGIGIMPYINMVRKSSHKYIVYELLLNVLNLLNPIYYDKIVKESKLTYDDIYSILGMMDYIEFRKQDEYNCLNDQLKKYEYRSSVSSHNDKLLLEAFQYDGLYQNMDLCKRFFYSNRHVIYSYDYLKMAPDIENSEIKNIAYTYLERILLFKIKPIDLLYIIKDRSKNEIELILNVLIIIKENIDVDLLKECNYKNLDYEDTKNYNDYPHQVFNYISKVEDYIVNNKILDDINLFIDNITIPNNLFGNKINKKIISILNEKQGEKEKTLKLI